jgi:hypothetical protein
VPGVGCLDLGKVPDACRSPQRGPHVEPNIVRVAHASGRVPGGGRGYGRCRSRMVRRLYVCVSGSHCCAAYVSFFMARRP